MKFNKIVCAALMGLMLLSSASHAQILTGIKRHLDSQWILDEKAVFFGNRPDTALGYKTSLTNDGLVLGLSADSNTLHICEYADSNFNWATADYTNPSILIHSTNQSTTEYMRMYHDGTNGIITTGTGIVSFPTGVSFAGSASYTTGIEFEGATADAFETTLAVTDPTADRTITLPDANGTVFLSGGAADAAGALFMSGQDLKYEGTTANAFEGILRFPADPTQDNLVAIPDSSGFMVLSDTDLQGATGFWGAANSLVYEGATADGFETTLTIADPTADQTFTLPDTSGTAMISTKATNAPDIASSIWGVNGGLTFEGPVANDFETTIAAFEPTADRTITLPDETGTVLLSGNPAAVSTLSANSTVTFTATTNIGWSIVAGANTACNTTCTNACVHGWETTAGEVAVDCADATADKCLCAGAN